MKTIAHSITPNRQHENHWPIYIWYWWLHSNNEFISFEQQGNFRKYPRIGMSTDRNRLVFALAERMMKL
jgi:hypothetical protein